MLPAISLLQVHADAWRRDAHLGEITGEYDGLYTTRLDVFTDQQLAAALPVGMLFDVRVSRCRSVRARHVLLAQLALTPLVPRYLALHHMQVITCAAMIWS
jgi:hypothetical protein